MKWYEIYDSNGKCVGAFPIKNLCDPYYGYCGGCAMCCAMQAHYAGLTVKEVDECQDEEREEKWI